MTREVFMPLLCADNLVNDQADKLMDIMHRIISQVAVAQSQIEVIKCLKKFNFNFSLKNFSFKGLGFTTSSSSRCPRLRSQQSDPKTFSPAHSRNNLDQLAKAD